MGAHIGAQVGADVTTLEIGTSWSRPLICRSPERDGSADESDA